MIIKIPENIDKYEPKTWGNFTSRQFFCLVLALPIIGGIFAGLFFLTNDTTISGVIAVVIAMPILMSGFAKTQGIYFNDILIRKIEDKKFSKPRKYVSQNVYSDLDYVEELIKEIKKGNLEQNEEKTTKSKFKLKKKK